LQSDLSLFDLNERHDLGVFEVGPVKDDRRRKV